MHCLNCGNADCFVLVVELAVRTRGPEEFAAPDWALALECADCASTDVAGDPAALLAARTG
ncbi:MAG: hypothetical protein ABEJ92_11755 [Halobacteriales archaeon]